VVYQTRPPATIIIIDQSQTKSPTEELEPQATLNPEIEFIYILAPYLTGLTHARNVGITQSKGDIVLFLDDDVELKEDYLEELLAVYQEDTEGCIGGVAGLDINLSIMSTSKFRRFAQRLFRKGMMRDILEEFRYNPVGVVETNRFSGCNMSFRKHVLQQFRFDENLLGYANAEDLDFSFRVSRHYKLMLAPLAKVYHHVSPIERDRLDIYFSNKIFHAYYLFRKNIPGTISNWFDFIWLNIGYMLSALISGHPMILSGTWDGYRRIVKVIFGGDVGEELRRELVQTRLPASNTPRIREQ
jgi:GT2 family glycosyltransferase